MRVKELGWEVSSSGSLWYSDMNFSHDFFGPDCGM